MILSNPLVLHALRYMPNIVILIWRLVPKNSGDFMLAGIRYLEMSSAGSKLPWEYKRVTKGAAPPQTTGCWRSTCGWLGGNSCYWCARKDEHVSQINSLFSLSPAVILRITQVTCKRVVGLICNLPEYPRIHAWTRILSMRLKKIFRYEHLKTYLICSCSPCFSLTVYSRRIWKNTIAMYSRENVVF